MQAVWMTLKSAATRTHFLTRVEFPTGFLNSRATLTLLTLREAPDFLGEAHRSTGVHEQLTTLCQTQRPIQPGILSPAVAISQCPGKLTARLPAMTFPTTLGWGYHDPIPLLVLPVSLLPAFTQSLVELLQISCNHRRSSTSSAGVQCVTASTERHVGGGKHE